MTENQSPENKTPAQQDEARYAAILAEELVRHPLRAGEDEDYSYAASQAYKRFTGQPAD